MESKWLDKPDKAGYYWINAIPFRVVEVDDDEGEMNAFEDGEYWTIDQYTRTFVHKLKWLYIEPQEPPKGG